MFKIGINFSNKMRNIERWIVKNKLNIYTKTIMFAYSKIIITIFVNIIIIKC